MIFRGMGIWYGPDRPVREMSREYLSDVTLLITGGRRIVFEFLPNPSLMYCSRS